METMQIFVVVLISIALVLLVLFASGWFETSIVKQCTACGKGGKLQPLSHFFEALYEGKLVSIFGYPGSKRKPFGVLHNHILCELCRGKVFRSIQARNQILAQVGDQVRRQVGIQVRNHVRDQILD